jgi:hypothetical protein
MKGDLIMKRTGTAVTLIVLTLPCYAADPPFRLVSDDKHETLLQFFPKTTDPWFNALKPRLVFYTEREMPAAYQSDGFVHSVHYNISANRSEPFGNANREFPWGVPAGLNWTNNARTAKFVVFPQSGEPIRWWTERLAHDRRWSYRWAYPVGTVFGEILTVTDPEGVDYTFEVRVRKKSDAGWRMDVYRPFTTPEELASKLKRVDPMGGRSGPLLDFLKKPTAEAYSFRNPHPVSIFNRNALDVNLPALDHELVRKLLTETPFKSALGQPWLEKDGYAAHAPSTQADFHIVPRNYGGALLAADSKQCMSCHETVQMHVNDFQPFRDWYGRVRGSDGIFSFHIFEHSSIAGNGADVPVYLRRDLTQAGLLKQWNAE